MLTFYNGMGVILSLSFLILYLLFKNPYSWSTVHEDFLYLYKHDTDYFSKIYGAVKREQEFIGEWGRNKEDAQRKIEQKYKERCPQLPKPIITKRCSYISEYYWLSIIIYILILVVSIIDIYRGI